jgi:hypothetical protein
MDYTKLIIFFDNYHQNHLFHLIETKFIRLYLDKKMNRALHHKFKRVTTNTSKNR